MLTKPIMNIESSTKLNFQHESAQCSTTTKKKRKEKSKITKWKNQLVVDKELCGHGRIFDIKSNRKMP